MGQGVPSVGPGDEVKTEKRIQGQSRKLPTMLAKCAECGRVFDLLDEEQASEFYFGHDCEETDD